MPSESDGNNQGLGPNNLTSNDANNGRRNRRQCYNNDHGGQPCMPCTEKVTGKWNDLNGNVYKISQIARVTKTFQKMTCKVAKYIGWEYDNAGDFSTGLFDLELQNLIESVLPKDPDANKIEYK